MNEYPPVSASPPPAPVPQGVRVALPQSVPYVTYTIIGITSFVFVLQLLSIAIFGRFSGGIDLLEAYGAMIGSAVRAGELWRLITPVLLHDNIFFMHILFNMYALFSFGTGLERHFGHRRFLILYLLGGFSGNVLSFLFSSGHSYSIGASTAVFGLVGAEGVFLYQNRRLFAGQFRSAIGNLVFIVGINLFLGFSSSNIDNGGHIGGLIGGLIFTFLAGPVWEVEGIQPMLQLVDQRPSREVIIGAATVIFIFGGLAMWGMVR